MMRAVCVVPPRVSVSPYDGRVRSPHTTLERFGQAGLKNVQPFYAVHAPSAGLMTTKIYDLDGPEREKIMTPRKVGSWLAHRTLWAALLLLPESSTFVLEEDASLPPGWRQRFDRAMAVVPVDYDLLFIGSCCTLDKPKKHVAEDVWEIHWPLCTHSYVVKGHETLTKLIIGLDYGACHAPIDLAMMLHAMPHLRVYGVLPRIAGQIDLPQLAE
jgi:hypothetical protein